MRHCLRMLTVFLLLGFLPPSATHAADAQATIIAAHKPSYSEQLAAKEIRRYVYLRTGALLPLTSIAVQGEKLALPSSGELILVGNKTQPEIAALDCDEATKKQIAALPPQGYLLKTIRQAERPVLLVVGGDAQGTLFAVYRLAEHLGVRFYLHGDVVPDERIAFALPELNEMRQPLFELRGIQPFHDFPEGPDWWNRDGYKAVVGQLPKLGMNFFGLHTYPEGGVGPEPLTWIGPADELAADGRVKQSYPSRHFTTSNTTGAWGYRPGKTSDYVFGADQLFDRDDYGADYMRDTHPWQQLSPEQGNELFNRTGDMLTDVFGYARRLGVKTCLGTETPLTIPAEVKKRLQAAGKNPADPAVVQSIYEGMFQRIAKTHPLDYYWLWTPEDWTWKASNSNRDSIDQKEIDATMADFRAVIAAAEKVHAPFTLATCGWVLGPPQSPALFDQSLPKNMPMSCINRTVGNTPVEPGFAKVEGRPKWAIPWLEDDPGLTMPQLWAGRMRRDAADALKYGCTGLMGIHWRTRILAPNVAALAQAGWDQHHWRGEATKAADGKSTFAPVADFYADWAATEFGPAAARQIGEIFVRLDGHTPRPADWITGPGSIKPEVRPWAQLLAEYAFVEQLEAIRPRIQGAGNLERFDYCLNNFRYLRSIDEVRSAWGCFDAAMAKAKAEKDPAVQKQIARDEALPARKYLIAAFADLHRYLLATVSNPGELGTVTNWQQQTLPRMITEPGQELAKLLGEPLPADAMPSKQYVGSPRLFVPEVRTAIDAGEPFRLTVIMLGGKPEAASLYWRPLGTGEFAAVPLEHVARGVYAVRLPTEAAPKDFEYYIEAQVAGQRLQFPPNGPALPQTVVVADK